MKSLTTHSPYSSEKELKNWKLCKNKNRKKKRTFHHPQVAVRCLEFHLWTRFRWTAALKRRIPGQLAVVGKTITHYLQKSFSTRSTRTSKLKRVSVETTFVSRPVAHPPCHLSSLLIPQVSLTDHNLTAVEKSFAEFNPAALSPVITRSADTAKAMAKKTSECPSAEE